MSGTIEVLVENTGLCYSSFLETIDMGFLFVCLNLFLEPQVHHAEVPRLRVESELKLPAYTTATES